MFSGESILSLLQLLTKRGVYLYHACQYQDFCSYLKIGGIPSRQRLEQNHLSVTPFTTDSVDKENNVWDKVFLNLEDFGRTFARGKGAVPNVYGPILFKFKAIAFAETEDIAICLRSAGAKGFSREKESLRSIEQVDELFYYQSNHPTGAHYLKFREGLQATFGSTAQSVEISCTLPHGVLSFANLIEIIVDPYDFDRHELKTFVEQKVIAAHLTVPVRRRRPQLDPKLYDILRRTAELKNPSPAFLAKITSSEHLKNWAYAIAQRGGLLEKNYGRYLQYLYEGTVRPIQVELDKLKAHQDENTSWRHYSTNGYDYDDYEDNFIDDDYYLIEEELLDFGHYNGMYDFLDELSEYSDNWTQSHDSGWFYSDNNDDFDGMQIY